MYIRRLAIVLAVALMSLPIIGAAQNAAPPPPNKKLDDAQKRELQALVTAVDNVQKGQPAPMAIGVTWHSAYLIKAQMGRTYVPFTVTIDPASLGSPGSAVYIRVADRRAAGADAKKEKDNKKGSEYVFEDSYFVDLRSTSGPLYFSRAFTAPGGDFDVFMAVKERAAPNAKAGDVAKMKTTVLKQMVTVPDLWMSADLTTSSLLLASNVETLAVPPPPEQQAENPYVLGPLKFTPAFDGKFKKSSEMSVVFWIYNAGADPANKPNVSVEYTFHEKAAEGEKYFNKTEPQELSAKTLPKEFDLAAGHQLMSALSIPLEKFPEGSYRLAIKVTDNITKKTLERDVQFTVVG